MPQTFDCPKCGAPVTLEPSADPANTRRTVRCDYCHSQLIAPDELAGRPAQVIQIQFGTAAGNRFPKWIWLILVIPLLGLIIGGLAAVGALVPAFYSVSRTGKEFTNPPRPQPPTKQSKSTFATVLLNFGREGIEI